MSTLLEIKTLAASYLDITVADFTVNSIDLFLQAANQVRKTAELNHDFEFNRKLVTVTVDGATGGDLGDAVDADSVAVDVKSVIEAGLLDDNANLRPVVWTTTAESIERQRQDNRGQIPTLWRADWEEETPVGQSRFTFSGSEIRRWPRTDDSETETFALWLEVYKFSADWTANDLLASTAIVTGTLSFDATGTYYPQGATGSGKQFYLRSAEPVCILYNQTGSTWILFNVGSPSASWTLSSSSSSPAGSYTPSAPATGTATVTASTGTSDIWTTHGAQYLLWATIVQLNHRWKMFVPRTEGNLPPPQQLAQEGLQTLIDWDANKYEQFRRHTR